MIEINLEESYPTVLEAMTKLKDYIKLMKKGDVALIIHGYGSSGKGGKIRKEARQWLLAQEKNGKIAKVVIGEDFEMFNSKARDIKAKDNDKDLLNYYGNTNPGITVIEK